MSDQVSTIGIKLLSKAASSLYPAATAMPRNADEREPLPRGNIAPISGEAAMPWLFYIFAAKQNVDYKWEGTMKSTRLTTKTDFGGSIAHEQSTR